MSSPRSPPPAGSPPSGPSLYSPLQGLDGRTPTPPYNPYSSSPPRRTDESESEGSSPTYAPTSPRPSESSESTQPNSNQENIDPARGAGNDLMRNVLDQLIRLTERIDGLQQTIEACHANVRRRPSSTPTPPPGSNRPTPEVGSGPSGNSSDTPTPRRPGLRPRNTGNRVQKPTPSKGKGQAKPLKPIGKGKGKGKAGEFPKPTGGRSAAGTPSSSGSSVINSNICDAGRLDPSNCRLEARSGAPDKKCWIATCRRLAHTECMGFLPTGAPRRRYRCVDHSGHVPASQG